MGRKRGIKAGTEFLVDFHFYAVKRNLVNIIEMELKDRGFSADHEKTRTLIFLKGFRITGKIKT